MTRSIRTISLLFATLTTLAAAPAFADSWQCADGAGSADAAACFVTNVRFNPDTSPYVRAKIHDPDGVTACTYVTIQLNTGGVTTEGVRGVESLLITALTTGLPIKFWKIDSAGSSTDCYATSVFLAKPGN